MIDTLLLLPSWLRENPLLWLKTPWQFIGKTVLVLKICELALMYNMDPLHTLDWINHRKTRFEANNND